MADGGLTAEEDSSLGAGAAEAKGQGACVPLVLCHPAKRYSGRPPGATGPGRAQKRRVLILYSVHASA